MLLNWDKFDDHSGEGGRIAKASSDWSKRGFKFLPVFRHANVSKLNDSLMKFMDWSAKWAAEVYRVLKPGGHLLAMGSTRTHGHMMVAMTMAGFEIRDCIGWCYLTGMTHSRDISKSFDKKAGVLEERKIIGRYRPPSMEKGWNLKQADDKTVGKRAEWGGVATRRTLDVTAPVTELAKKWNGWGTGLRPAWEPIVVVRKPCDGAIIDNVEKYGVGGINIDGNRMSFENEGDAKYVVNGASRINKSRKKRGVKSYKNTSEDGFYQFSKQGRWPTNVIRIEPFGDELDKYFIIPEHFPFISVPKPRNKERHAGCGDLFWRAKDQVIVTEEEWKKLPKDKRGKGNIHVCVKPVELMVSLIKLVTPDPDIVKRDVIILDPFLGSGTTAIACELTKRKYIGIDQKPEYIKIAKRRIVANRKNKKRKRAKLM